MVVLSGLAPPFGVGRGGDLCGLYSALSQDGKLVVEDIPLVVQRLCFGKAGGVTSCLVGPIQWYCWTGPQRVPISVSRINAAIVCPDLSLQDLCCNSVSGSQSPGAMLLLCVTV